MARQVHSSDLPQVWEFFQIFLPYILNAFAVHFFLRPIPTPMTFPGHKTIEQEVAGLGVSAH